MPRLTRKIEAAKQKAASDQLIEFLRLVPVVRDELAEAEIEELMAEDEANGWRYWEEPKDDPPVKLRHKLRSKTAHALQLEVYRRYVRGDGIRKIARDLHRHPSTIQRALELAIQLTGGHKDTPAIVFAEVDKCPKCRKGLAERENYCRAHEKKLAAVTETKSYLRELGVGSSDLIPSNPMQEHLAL